jgi:hypothetical protein
VGLCWRLFPLTALKARVFHGRAKAGNGDRVASGGHVLAYGSAKWAWFGADEIDMDWTSCLVGPKLFYPVQIYIMLLMLKKKKLIPSQYHHLRILFTLFNMKTP